MVHAESMSLGCVCPECGARCRACLGTDTVISREDLLANRDRAWFTPNFDAETASDGPAPASDDEESAREHGRW